MSLILWLVVLVLISPFLFVLAIIVIWAIVAIILGIITMLIE